MMNQNQLDRVTQVKVLRVKVDEVCDEDLPHLGASSPDRKSLYYKANALKGEVGEASDMLSRLSLRNEKMSTAQFESKKQEETRRLAQLQDKLNQILNQLEPDEIEEDYFRQVADQGPSVSDINSVVEDDGLGDDVDADDYDTDTDVLEIKRVQGLTDFEGQEEGDLSFKKGDVLTIVQTSEDGWWLARNSEGQEGIVPSTYLKVLEPDTQEKETQPEERQQSVPGVKKPPPIEKKRSGKDLWEMMKQPKVEKTSEVDVLKAMKAMPAGFRESTLSTLLKDDSYKISSWVVPKLSESNLSFRDLFWDPVNKKLRPRIVRVTRTFTIQAARMIPPPGAGLSIKSRHVRIALWDGKRIRSNVHTLRAIPVENDEATWSFNPKVTRTVPTLYDSECMVRTNSEQKNLNLLFELNYTYERTTSGERGEVSCGWSSLPLFENDGNAVVNKTYELTIHGGTPYDRNVDLDPSVSLQANASLFQSLIRTNRQPRLVVRCTSYNKLSKDRFDLLPDVIITAQSNVKFITYFREILASMFLKDDMARGGLICDPVLACFPKTLDYPDLLDALKLSWDDKMRSNVRRSQKRDPAFLLSLFRQTFIESSFAIMHCVDFPPYSWANEEVEKERLRFILSFQENKDPLAMMLSRQVRYKPLNTNKLSFDVLSEHCLPFRPSQPS